jgi:hypothetical protein
MVVDLPNSWFQCRHGGLRELGQLSLVHVMQPDAMRSHCTEGTKTLDEIDL